MWLEARSRAKRFGLVMLGIVAGQFILYGASFAGTKILLPLDTLVRPGIYIPLRPDQASPEPHTGVTSSPMVKRTKRYIDRWPR